MWDKLEKIEYCEGSALEKFEGGWKCGDRRRNGIEVGSSWISGKENMQEFSWIGLILGEYSNPFWNRYQWKYKFRTIHNEKL